MRFPLDTAQSAPAEDRTRTFVPGSSAPLYRGRESLRYAVPAGHLHDPPPLRTVTAPLFYILKIQMNIRLVKP